MSTQQCVDGWSIRTVRARSDRGPARPSARRPGAHAAAARAAQPASRSSTTLACLRGCQWRCRPAPGRPRRPGWWRATTGKPGGGWGGWGRRWDTQSKDKRKHTMREAHTHEDQSDWVVLTQPQPCCHAPATTGGRPRPGPRAAPAATRAATPPAPMPGSRRPTPTPVGCAAAPPVATRRAATTKAASRGGRTAPARRQQTTRALVRGQGRLGAAAQTCDVESSASFALVVPRTGHITARSTRRN